MSKLTAPIKIKDLEDGEADRREGQRQAAKLKLDHAKRIAELAVARVRTGASALAPREP